MKFAILAIALSYLLSVTVSRRTNYRRHMTSQNFAASCTQEKVNANGIFSAVCKLANGSAAPTRYDLKTLLSNTDGVLKTPGVAYQNSCTGCSLTMVAAAGANQQANFTCSCKNENGTVVSSTIDLNTILNNSNGVLTVPVPVPKN